VQDAVAIHLKRRAVLVSGEATRCKRGGVELGVETVHNEVGNRDPGI
jgi:hypothetical protein